MAGALILLILFPSMPGAVASRLVINDDNATFFIGTSIQTINLTPNTRRSQAAAFNLIAFHIDININPTIDK